MKIEVTQEDIREGVPEDHKQCAISQALLRMGYESPSCTPVEISFYDGPRGYVSYRTTIEARTFMDRFDEGKRVQPCTLDLSALY